MKKIIPILIVGMLVLSGLGAVALSSEKMNTGEIIDSVTFSNPSISNAKGNYLQISVDEAKSWLLDEGKPELPIYVKTFILPKTARNIQIELTPLEINSMEISGEIVPTQFYRIGYDIPDENDFIKDELTYASTELYPDTWYSHDIGRGLKDREPVAFIKIICHVVRYAPAENRIEFLQGMDIRITYDYEDIGTTNSDNDLIIITPARFESAYQKLADHKNDAGVSTTIKTVEDILDECEGHDAPEQIKYFIKDMHETEGTMYFLLGAGLKSMINADDKDDHSQGTKDWLVPVRYTNIPRDDGHGVISDLYYSDIYEEGDNFSSWDSNGDGKYAEWGVDELDLYPDVFVSRLPCRNIFQVKRVVKKIINYESTSPDNKPWFRTMIANAGRTFSIFEGQPDGEYVCDTMFEYMDDLIDEEVRVYASNIDSGGLVPTPEDIPKAYREGAGYVTFMGHGFPIGWNTHWPTGSNWTGGIKLYSFWKLFNRDELPVVVVGGCHNALFNVSLLKSINQNLPTHWYWTHGAAAPVCMNWGLILVPWGGAIATAGCTGYGIGGSHPIVLSSELEANFFYEIGQGNATTPAEAHHDAITKYIIENDIMMTEAFCITEWELFADPSMIFGGYE